jgi:hypothetical protein
MTPVLERARRTSLGVAIAGLSVCAAGWVLRPVQFYHSWLFAWFFWLGVALGCLSIVMLQYVTGGAWGVVIRRLLEAGSRTLPAMSVLFLPLLFGLQALYPWARPDEVAGDELLQHKAAYLNVPFFVLRTGIYFAVWCTLAWLLNRWSRRQDESGDAGLEKRFQALSSGGLVLLVLTMTFAAVDWLMSLEPHWFSTIYGVLLMAGQGVSAFCLVIAAAVLLSRAGPLAEAIRPNHLHDLAKLLFAFILVWAYFALSQFLIIWSGNLPEEIPWYLRRLQGGWQYVGLTVIVLHFALPFGLLLSRRVKRHPARLLGVALLVLAVRHVDLYWMVAPVSSAKAWPVHWLDFGAALGVGGLWVFLFTRQVSRMPLLPRRDPYLQEALEHGRD